MDNISNLTRISLLFAVVNWGIFFAFIKSGINPIALLQGLSWSIIFVLHFLRKQKSQP